MARAPDLITSAEVEKMLPLNKSGNVRRLEPFVRRGKIVPAMRAGTGKRSPLLFHRADAEKLRDRLIAELKAQLADLATS